MTHLKTFLSICYASAVDGTDQLWLTLVGGHRGPTAGERESESESESEKERERERGDELVCQYTSTT